MSKVKSGELLEFGEWEWTPDDNLLEWDEVQFRIYGVDPDTPVNFDLWASLVHPDDLSFLIDKANALLKDPGRSFNFCFRIIRANKETAWLRTIARVYTDPTTSKVKMRGVNYDASEQINQSDGIVGIEVTRQDDFHRMERALEISKIGVFDWDIRTNHLYWDENMFSMYGVTHSRFENNFKNWEKAVHPDDIEEANEDPRRSIDENFDFNTRFRVIKESGEIRWVKAQARVFRDSEGAPYRMLGVNQDITELVKIEEQVEVERQTNLQNSKMASLGELAAGVGHEINNPLAVILGFIPHLRKDLYQDLGQEHKSLATLDKIEKSTKRIAEIVKNLLTFSRFGDENVSFDFIETLRDSVELVSEMYVKFGIDIFLNIPAGQKMWVYGNSSRLQQVIVNLLSNSKDALEESGFLQKERGKISIEILSNREVITFRFQDNGPGIPDKIKHRIFDNFFTTKEVGKGNGIGLNLSAQIVKEHGGRIELLKGDPSLKRGACFEIVLPLDQNFNPRNEEDSSIQETFSGKVMLVDDEDNVREVFKNHLSSLGLEFADFSSPSKAITYFEKNEKDIDFVFTDINMPEFNGIELLKKVRSISTDKPCFLITGGAIALREEDRSDIDRMSEGILYKPFELEKVRESLSLFYQKSKKAS